jgi:hypothetical protein
MSSCNSDDWPSRATLRPNKPWPGQIFSDDGISEVKYTETEHYQVTKDFLNRHERMLELLISAEDEDLESKRRKR